MEGLKFRGILHNHSACSKEGCYPLTVLRERWASSLDFAAMTEHAERTTAQAYMDYVQSCAELSDDQFRFIPGLEVATTSGDMLLLGCRKFICTTDPFRVLQEVEHEGCVILLAHPEQGKIMPDILRQVDGFEAWNSGHMGGYMPPLDWFLDWRRRYALGKIMTGGNDIHTIDPRSKIVTLVESESRNEEDLLNAIGNGHFITTNGIFSCTSSGHTFVHNKNLLYYRLTGHRVFAAIARVYRASWRSSNACIEFGSTALTTIGVDKAKRTQLNRLIRQYL